jgi:hypothetical protein
MITVISSLLPQGGNFKDNGFHPAAVASDGISLKETLIYKNLF